MSGALFPIYRWQVFQGAIPAAGAKLYSFVSGTSTPLALYSDYLLTVPLSNPVVADSYGVFPTMYLGSSSYRILVTDALGVTIFPAQDNIYDLYQIFLATAQLANTVFAGPSSGASAAAAFRPLVLADLPTTAINPGICQTRLTLTSGTPVTTADVTAATSLFVTPYAGNRLGLYNGSTWDIVALTEQSIVVPAPTNQMYDAFVYNNAGTPTLELTAWTNDTTRATALTTQDGVYVKSGALTRRYLGSFRTTAVAGQAEDSVAKRFLWNYYNRAVRPMRRFETTGTWNYTTATWRQANAAVANQLAFVIGVAEVPVQASLRALYRNANQTSAYSAIGEDSTTAPSANGTFGGTETGALNSQLESTAFLHTYPAVGYHFWPWLEISGASGTTNWFGLSGSNYQLGMVGWLEG